MESDTATKHRPSGSGHRPDDAELRIGIAEEAAAAADGALGYSRSIRDEETTR